MIRLSIVRDISERKRAEESLLEAQEQFRVLSESALVGVYLIQDNVFRYVNPAAARMYGYAVDEIVGRSATALAHPDDRALIAENLPRRLEGEVEEARYQLRGFRKDGSVFPVEVHGRRIVLGGKVAVLGAVMGISERKRAERRLLAQHEVTRALAEPRTLEEAAPRLLQAIGEGLGWDVAGLWRLEPERDALRPVELWHAGGLAVSRSPAESP